MKADEGPGGIPRRKPKLRRGATNGEAILGGSGLRRFQKDAFGLGRLFLGGQLLRLKKPGPPDPLPGKLLERFSLVDFERTRLLDRLQVMFDRFREIA